MLVGSLHQDSGEELGSWTYVNFTLTRKLVWLRLLLHPLFCVPSYYDVDSTTSLIKGLFSSHTPRARLSAKLSAT